MELLCFFLNCHKYTVTMTHGVPLFLFIFIFVNYFYSDYIQNSGAVSHKSHACSFLTLFFHCIKIWNSYIVPENIYFFTFKKTQLLLSDTLKESSKAIKEESDL